ncbi:hypothetical protein BDB00DRAFT_873150 [Zychaea mexicana]|uniref:uncharacterized protein n=1 Tax=Zychaea mexicana TaxID=64656 RepID=UPI0022FDD184|nr:uncharacterized protein BDB00DRAFT_873150 [Zychaea mexicana]KAI9492754.1 hypothetical protein BDB00DRAFT_873150 [Zychaea mexicana]
MIPDKLGVPGNIALSIIWNYIHEWGYIYRRNSKDIYYDGHERQDVVEYRKKWARQMMNFVERTDTFLGDDMRTVIPPELRPGQQKIVFVTHDECTFYANDGKSTLWLQEGENVLRKKGPGLSIMVSEFQCPCHGTMKIKGWTSRRVIHAGANRDGYWTRCQAVFLFDQSSNHNAYKNDALVASWMPIQPKLKCEMPYEFKLTSFHLGGATSSNTPVTDEHENSYAAEDSNDDENTYHQSLYYKVPVKKGKKGKEKTENVWYFKGIMRILKDRQLWMEEDLNRPSKKWRGFCNAEPMPDNCCCGRHLLAAQPDSASQKTAPHEEVLAAGHLFALYPKFHCECYWGAAKREARLKCEYTFKALQEHLHDFLDSAGNPVTIQSQDLNAEGAAKEV